MSIDDDYVRDLELLVSDQKEIIRQLRERGFLQRAHRRFCLFLDRIIPPGTKSISFAALQAAIAAGPAAMAGVWPFDVIPVETRDWLFHVMTTNPRWWVVAILVVLYLNICARQVIDYRQEAKHE